MLAGKRILLIIGGGIAAYKCLELIRRLRDRGASVRCILTKAGEQFVTPLSVSALSGEKVYQELFSLTDEAEMGHIRLSREADVVLVAPATADLMAKMAGGHANDLATTALLATNKPVLIAPSMNTEMWAHLATQANLATLKKRGIGVIGPAAGDLACGEIGSGRLSEVPEIIAALETFFGPKPLAGKRAIVTGGPTHEPIDPVRYIGNRSSGKLGNAIATALADLGAEVHLVTGPTNQPDPVGVRVTHIETTREMLAAVEGALPADILICNAAVADWRPATEAGQKLKKQAGGMPPALALQENPDILATLSRHAQRPALVVGFAAETENVIEHATSKLSRKGCDWILANDVSPERGVFGGDSTTIHLITQDGHEDWPTLPKGDVGRRLASRITDHFAQRSQS
ncbi:bifunctional phosphopantothenoylcysteine decarboxylase/phosphopantothenate--cysteine ligase CoaBC [Lacibacterium aquatile]|uniref:Coenzyme A biosynthesis bifunctional protein CoaBC n=1 Tax=Lacibacterium aquatile TaxID=1168082 RepID=A0ABW5DUF8_9PROT